MTTLSSHITTVRGNELMKKQMVKAVCITLVVVFLVPLLAAASSIEDILASMSDSELEELRGLIAKELEARSHRATRGKKLTNVYIVTTGTKYHSNIGCSGMKHPFPVSVSDALLCGYTPCKKCFNSR